MKVVPRVKPGPDPDAGGGDSDSSGLSGGYIALIVIGSVIGVAGLGFLISYLIKKRKEKGSDKNYKRLNVPSETAKSEKGSNLSIINL